MNYKNSIINVKNVLPLLPLILVILLYPYFLVNPNRISTGINAFLVFFSVLFVILPFFSRKEAEKTFIFKTVMGAFLIRSLIAFILVSTAIFLRGDQFGGWSFANDGYRYLNASVRIIEYLEQGGSLLDLFQSTDKWRQVAFISNYFPVIAFVITYLFDGTGTLLPGSIYSAFVGSLSVFFVYKMTQYALPDESKHQAQNAALLAAIFPSYIMFTSVFLKESTVILITCISLYLFALAYKTKKLVYILMILALIGFVGLIRFYAAGAIAFALLTTIFLLSLNIKNPVQTGLSLLKVGILVAIVLIFGGKLLNFEFLLNNVLDIDRLDYVRNMYYGAGDTYFEVGDLTSPLGIIKAIPVGLAYLFLSPFPWQWFVGDDWIEMVLAPDMICYYLLIPATVVGLIKLIKQKNPMAFAIIAYVLIISVPYSILIGNFGTIYRLRTQLLPYIFIFASVGGIPVFESMKNFLLKVYIRITNHQIQKPT